MTLKQYNKKRSEKLTKTVLVKTANFSPACGYLTTCCFSRQSDFATILVNLARSSATAERPRCHLKSCQLLHNCKPTKNPV